MTMYLLIHKKIYLLCTVQRPAFNLFKYHIRKITNESMLVNRYFDPAVSLVKTAGNYIKEHISGCKEFQVKSGDIDLVTDVDKKVEKTLIEGLSKLNPDHKFIGEETVSGGAKCELTDTPTWVLDPVDGTMNFIHGFPHSCIALGLLVNKEAVAGIVYNPILGQLFTSKKGKGVFYNGRPIHVSKTKEMSKSLIITESGASRDKERQRVFFENFQTIITKTRGYRSLGSAALNMCMVAMGGADLNFHFGINIWDIAAGVIIVREAGGVCIDPTGAPLDMLSRRVLCASTSELAQEMATHLCQYYPERD